MISAFAFSTPLIEEIDGEQRSATQLSLRRAGVCDHAQRLALGALCLAHWQRLRGATASLRQLSLEHSDSDSQISPGSTIHTDTNMKLMPEILRERDVYD